MVGLLDLPLELREPILLDVVVDTIQEQPAQPPSRWDMHKCGYQDVEIAGNERRRWEFDCCKHLRRHAMQLLHVNQQIRGEVVDIVLRRLAQRTDDAKLDIIFDDDTRHPYPSSSWATWLSAPFPAQHLNNLHTQIRYFQNVPFADQFFPHSTPGNVMADCDSWIDHHIVGMLFRFLAEFLHPQTGNVSVHEHQRTTATKGSRPLHRTIQKLVIEIPVDSTVPSSREAGVRCIRCAQDNQSITDRQLHCMVPSSQRTALVFAMYLQEELAKFFHGRADSHRDNTLPRMIFEHVGTVDLNVHGRLFVSFNLGEILAKMPGSEQWCGVDLRRARFFEWKRAAEDKRKEAGFELIYPSVQENNLAGPAGFIGSILAARGDSLLGDVVTSSDDAASHASQQASNEEGSFTAEAVLFRQDGSKIAGDATFYCPTDFLWRNMHHVSNDLEPYDVSNPWDYSWESGSFFTGYMADIFVKKPLGERPREGERVLFEGEAIVFPAQHRETIVSGEAIFYGKAEEAGTKQPPISRGCL